MPMRPNWNHQTLALEIAPEGGRSHSYTFRTLSLYDVWCLWDILVAGALAAKNHKPIEFAEKLLEGIEQVCPELGPHNPDRDHLTSTHFDAISEFYGRQDWGRIMVLLEDPDGNGPALHEGGEPEDSERRFFAIAAAAAKFANMSVREFMTERFEFCADAIIALRDEYRKVEARSGKMNMGQLGTVLSQFTSAVRYEEGDERPAWITAIEEETGPPPKVQ